MRSMWIIAFLAIILLVGACSGNTAGNDDQNQGLQGSDFGNATIVTVDIENDVYSIDPISIPVNTVVRWENHDPYAHEIKSSEFGTVRIKGSDYWMYQFEAKGVFTYEDKRNPQKQLRILVN